MKKDMVPIFFYYNRELELFIVQMPLNWNWKVINAEWMDDDMIGDNPEIPSIDVEQMKASFKDQNEALRFVAHLYQWQLK